jgi:hypothetical protein
MLNPEILHALREKTGRKEKTIRNNISSLRRGYASLPINCVAQIYALQNNTSISKMLTPEEKKAIPHLSIVKSVTIRQKRPRTLKNKSIKQFIKYDTSDPFIKGHVEEVNKCYTYSCYTAAFILCRKIIENLLIDIIKRKYPKRELHIYFNTDRGRTRDFSEIISNLRSRARDFLPDKVLLEKILTEAEKFKVDANNKAHSWYHLVRKSELENADVQNILEMLQKLQKGLT